ARKFFVLVLMLLAAGVSAQQVSDSSFRYKPHSPAYPNKIGTVVHVDEAHNNFHTLSTRYYTFGKVLAADGYQPKPFNEKFSDTSLKDCRILVIANAIAPGDTWSLPTPSAFTQDEADALKRWVQNGGSLFLIADHMPCPGAAAPIGNALNVNLYNGYALHQKNGPETFTRSSGLFHDNVITNGRIPAERVDSITIFTGHAFLPVRSFSPIIAFGNDHRLMLPVVAGEFSEKTPFIEARGLFHSVFFSEGKGRVVIAAEAAMFSAQLAGPDKARMGMNEPTAKNNAQLLLNIIHWLDWLIK
ncbi:MAG TPA: hypothetical protein VEB86_16815, partial [Chryseosolibacter sp.]|nr:hypothetical protein [Chryseosolibacter sp.]